MTTIRRGLLSELFIGVVAKKLTLVETITQTSNQHEFQGIKPLRMLFGHEDRKGIQTRFIWLAEEQEGLTEDGFISWSNVRKGKPRSPEYHLYYSGNAVTEMMQVGDTLFLALRPDGSVLVIVAPADSTMQSQLLWLFGLSEQALLEFEFREIKADQSSELDFAARYILDELGIDLEEPEADKLDTLIEKFGLNFPETSAFSLFARSTLSDVHPLDDPDKVLMAWVEQEELLFRRLERHIVAERLRSGFTSEQETDVEGFMAFSLSVQNRRKRRACLALETHLAALFQAHSLRFGHNVETEHGNKPDFLFPGADAYHDPNFPAEFLTVLGAKSTLKDRWRQVLSEAERISLKHLLTLEPGISENQTAEIQIKGVRLVVPKKLYQTFKPAQQNNLIDVSQFIKLVADRQARMA